MKKILMSIMTIGIALGMLGAGTLSFFSDWEISADNEFVAGTMDLLVDCRSTHTGIWPGGHVYESPIIFEEKDLVAGDKIFNWHDVKPGDNGEATISFHVYDNDAWLWLRVNYLEDFGGAYPEPEAELYPDAGELSQYIDVMIWLDEGQTPGFQGDDPGEGDNIWNYDEPILFDWDTLENLYMHGWLMMDPWHLVACEIWYIGWAWEVDTTVDNIIQGDYVEFDIEFYAEQYRNNETPVAP